MWLLHREMKPESVRVGRAEGPSVVLFDSF